MSRWRTIPDDARGVNRALQEATKRGDTKTARKLTARAVQIQMQLYGGGSEEQRKRDQPFDDDLSFLPK